MSDERDLKRGTRPLRVARPVSDLARSTELYSRGLGLRVIDSFEDHEGFDGVILGTAAADYHLEFTQCRSAHVRPTPTPEDLIVLYVPEVSEWRALCVDMLAAGFERVASFNPYWETNGCTYQDHDGYRVVLQRARWPASPSAVLRVRHARHEDRAHLLELWERSARATHHFLRGADVDALRPLVAAELASDAVAWWVAESDAGVLLGFLGFARDAIAGLFVDPDHLGQGVGTLLVEHAQGLTAGALRVDVNEQNEAGVRFYEARGFVVEARSPTDEGGRAFPILHMRRKS